MVALSFFSLFQSFAISRNVHMGANYFEEDYAKIDTKHSLTKQIKGFFLVKPPRTYGLEEFFWEANMRSDLVEIQKSFDSQLYSIKLSKR